MKLPRMSTLRAALGQLEDEGDRVVDADIVLEHEGSAVLMVTLVSEDGGAQALVEVFMDGTLELLDMDSVIGDSVSTLGLQTLGTVLGRQAGDPPTLPPSPNIPSELAGADRIGYVAEHFIDRLNSGGNPDTDDGNLACAWAVNYVIRTALGAGLGPAAAMLSTRNMFAALQNGRGNEIPLASARRGDIVISPTNMPHPAAKPRRKRIGHVGILIDDDRIANNSSARKRWVLNRTKASWLETYFDGKGLITKAFRVLP